MRAFFWTMALGASLALPASARTQETGISMESLRRLDQAGQARAETQNTPRATTPAIAPASKPATSPSPSPEISATPLAPPAVPAQVPTSVGPRLVEDCAPVLRVARTTSATAAFLLDAPCLAGLPGSLHLGTNPPYEFTANPQGRAEFIVPAPQERIHPVRVIDPATGAPILVQIAPQASVFIYEKADR